MIGRKGANKGSYADKTRPATCLIFPSTRVATAAHHQQHRRSKQSRHKGYFRAERRYSEINDRNQKPKGGPWTRRLYSRSILITVTRHKLHRNQHWRLKQYRGKKCAAEQTAGRKNRKNRRRAGSAVPKISFVS